MDSKNLVSGSRLIIGYLGLFIIIIGIICFIPLAVIPFYKEEVVYAKCFIIPAVIAIFLGYLLYFLIRNKEKANLENQQDAQLLLSVWVVAIIIGSVPFVLSGQIDIISAIFESTSGFTTSGITVLVPEDLPHIFLFYRSLLLFFGGIGLVLILASAISDKYGMKLYLAEGHSDKLVPNLMRSARVILSIYVIYIILGTLLYCACGMNTFDAINHSISALSTGGFSTHSESIMYFNNVGIEIVTTILMILGATNFMIHLYLIKGKFKEIKKHTELKFALIVISVSILIMLISIIGKFDFWTCLRYSVFTVISLITTTCFSSEFLTIFPSSMIILVIILIFIGGESGSTGGGLKRYRVALMIKSLWWNLKSKFSNKRVIEPHFMFKAGKKNVITTEDVNDNFSFIVMFLFVFLIGVALFCIDGMSIYNAFIEFSGIITGAGTTTGLVTSQSSALTLITSIFGMLLGRLEVVIVLIIIAKGLSNIKRRVMYENK